MTEAWLIFGGYLLGMLVASFYAGWHWRSHQHEEYETAGMHALGVVCWPLPLMVFLLTPFLMLLVWPLFKAFRIAAGERESVSGELLGAWLELVGL